MGPGALRDQGREGACLRAFAVTACLLSLAARAEAPAADPAQIEDPDVRACAERALPEHDLMQNLLVQVVDRTESVRESSGTLYWKRFDNGRSKVLVRLTAPPHQAGLAVLLIEHEGSEPEVYLYSPELRRDRRITGGALAGPLLGTDFSYEDFAHFQQIASTGRVKRVEDADLEGHPSYVLETLPDEEVSAYSRIRTYIDKEQCLPIKTEFFAPNGSLHKELLIERGEVQQVNGRWIPFKTVMIDHKQDSRSVLVLTDVNIDSNLSDHLFTPAGLRKGS